MDIAFVQKIERFLSDEESSVETLDVVFRISAVYTNLLYFQKVVSCI